MKIVHVICSLNTGGAELMLLDIIREQSASGHSVGLVVTNRSYEQALVDKIPGSVCTVFVNRPEGSHNPLWLLKINMAVRRFRPDIVHFHNDKGAGMCFPRLTGGRSVATVHDTNISLNHYLRLDRLYAISVSVRDDLKSRYGIDAEVVINGISTDRVKSNDGFKRPLPRVFKVVQVSRLDHGKKGQDLLIEAVSRLSDLGYKLSVDFIGDGSSCGFLQKLCGDKGISDRVHFLGTCSRDYVYEHLKDYNLLVQPSRYEGFGLTVAEAMAAKIPVLVSDIEGPMEVIGHGRFGHAFKCGSADSLTAVLRSVLDNHHAADDLAQGDAYDYARTNFSVATSASRYIDLYKSIVDTAK